MRNTITSNTAKLIATMTVNFTSDTVTAMASSYVAILEIVALRMMPLKSSLKRYTGRAAR
jgi:hypothetical protein